MNQLSSEQLAFFRDNGYLILPGLLDREQCAAARDRMWAALPPEGSMRRDDPASWRGPFPDNEASDDPLHIRRGQLWQLRECGTEPLLIDLVCNPRLLAIAEQMLGEGTLVPPVPGGEPMGSQGAAWPGGPTDPAIGDGIRGIYFTRPLTSKTRLPDAGHTDGHPFNLGMVGLIGNTPPEGGAFKVWPGSHRRLYPTFQMQYDQPRIPYYEHLPSHKGIIHSDAYLRELERIHEDTEPVDCHGEEGDVVLWHHRLLHMAGHNYSDGLRQAVLYDFTRKDLDQCRLDPPQADMWRDWSAELRESGNTYSRDFAATQHLPSAQANG